MEGLTVCRLWTHMGHYVLVWPQLSSDGRAIVARPISRDTQST